MDKSKTGLGRRRWTSKRRQRLLAKFHQSQFTQSEFACQYGLGLSTLNRWLRLERQTVPAKVKFQEVQLPSPTSRWPVEVVSPRLDRAMELIPRRTLPQGLLGQAIDYTLKRWTALNQFVEDGTLEIDNNLIENAIRPGALGKKNWLFVGHPEAGERSAVIYTLLGSCRRHGVSPFNYLKDLFARLPAAKITQIKQFTRAEWAATTDRWNPATTGLKHLVCWKK
jgi:transposase-like protein